MWKRFSLKSLKLNKKFSLSQQIVILITLVVCIALLPASLFTTYRVSKVIYDRVSINAVSINNILCNSDEIKNGLQAQNYRVSPLVDNMMSSYVNQVDHSDEAGVAIYDKHGRLRVMYNPGSLPNFEESARDFNKSTIDAVLFLLLTTCFGLVIGILGAIFLAGGIKKVLFGYEPEEIARLLQERNIILNSVREGIININANGIITVVNFEAKMLLKQADIADTDDLCGKSAMDVLKHVPLHDIIKEGRSFADASIKFGNTVFVMTAVPLLGLDGGQRILGAVITFRKKSVVEELANQLTGFKNYATALRAQTHEFMNKMHVIMGLIDMKAYDELKNYTKEIAYNRQSEVSYIVTRLKDITLSGFILGKISRSRELDIDFSLSEESEIHGDLDVPSVHDLVLIAGNLIENAFDALKNFDGERIVNLSILDFDKEIVIVVEDSGPGMSEETIKQIYHRGFSTKGDSGHGFGLFLAKQSVDSLNGTISVESSLGEGTVFTVRLPVKKEVD